MELPVKALGEVKDRDCVGLGLVCFSTHVPPLQLKIMSRRVNSLRLCMRSSLQDMGPLSVSPYASFAPLVWVLSHLCLAACLR